MHALNWIRCTGESDRYKPNHLIKMQYRFGRWHQPWRRSSVDSIFSIQNFAQTSGFYTRLIFVRTSVRWQRFECAIWCFVASDCSFAWRFGLSDRSCVRRKNEKKNTDFTLQSLLHGQKCGMADLPFQYRRVYQHVEHYMILCQRFVQFNFEIP